jgi:putative FmdB family regulatory protein
MPLYSYECDNCGVQFDKLQKFSDKPIRRCPECSKNTAKRVIQPAGIIFKGSGWYKTDSRSSSSATVPSSTKKDSKKSDSSETKSESKAESKTESKTETKTESKKKSED